MRKGSEMQRGRIKLDLLVHDLKSPLAVIEAGTNSLLNRPDKFGSVTAKQTKVLKRILRNAKITQMLVDDTLELGRSREKKVCLRHFALSNLIIYSLVELFDLNDYNTSQSLRKCSNLKKLNETLNEKDICLSINEKLWHQKILQDEKKIKQILRNLLSNALKYRKKTVELVVSKEDDCLIIEVKDDGKGIPSIYHEKIFDCYFQVNSSEFCDVRGHGLGLAGALVLVEDMGGEMILDSEEGEGANFLVRLPLMLS